MTCPTMLSRVIACSVVIPMLSVAAHPQSHVKGLPTESHSLGLWRGLAAYQGGSVVGSWSGTKIENNPSNSGYITLNFNFSFSPDGTYRESAYQGGQKVMSAGGIYQQNGDRLSFRPQRCTFITPELGRTVKFFPIPTDSPATEIIYFSALQGGGQMSLKAVGSGDQWGLKPAPEDDSADLAGGPPRDVPAVAAEAAVPQVQTPPAQTADRSDPQRAANPTWAIPAAPQRAPASRPQTRPMVPSPRGLKPLPPNAAPEAIFNYVSNPIEVDFYEESTPNQRRVILDHAVLRYRRSMDGRQFEYDDFPIDLSSEAIFKALSEPDVLDMYNQENVETQQWMQRQGVVRYVEFRLGIKLTREQEQRLIRDKERLDAMRRRR